MGPGTRVAREVIRVAWGVHGPVFLTAVRGHDPSRRRYHHTCRSRLLVRMAGRCRCGQILRSIYRRDAHEWMSWMERRDHGVRRARALVRPEGLYTEYV